MSAVEMGGGGGGGETAMKMVQNFFFLKRFKHVSRPNTLSKVTVTATVFASVEGQQVL